MRSDEMGGLSVLETALAFGEGSFLCVGVGMIMCMFIHTGVLLSVEVSSRS